MVLSLIGLVAAQLWAMMLVGAQEEGLGAKDVILGGKLWRATLRRLPATRRPVWLGAWCLTALVCGGAVIGGFNYWLDALRAEKLRRAAEALAESAPDLTVKDTGRGGKGMNDLVEPLSRRPSAGAGDNRPVAQCVVIGYRVDADNLISLIIATMDGDRLKYAGAVKTGPGEDGGKELLAKLSRLARGEPLIPGLKMKGVFWVKPGVFCDVNHSGTDKDGLLAEPALKGLLD
jgi:hypothetical protein